LNLLTERWVCIQMGLIGSSINKKKRAISRVGYYLFIDNSVIYDLEFYNYL